MAATNAAAGMSTFRKNVGKQSVDEKKLELMVKCGDCDTRIHAFVKVKDQLRERKFCKDCFNKNHRKDRTGRPSKQPGSDQAKNKSQESDSASALFELGSMNLEAAAQCDQHKSLDTISIASMGSPRCPDKKAIGLDHHISIQDQKPGKRDGLCHSRRYACRFPLIKLTMISLGCHVQSSSPATLMVLLTQGHSPA